MRARTVVVLLWLVACASPAVTAVDVAESGLSADEQKSCIEGAATIEASRACRCAVQKAWAAANPATSLDTSACDDAGIFSSARDRAFKPMDAGKD